MQRGGQLAAPAVAFAAPELDPEDVADLDDAPEQEVEDAEARVLDQATAARSIAEPKAEIETLKGLESLALHVRRAGRDAKWRELAALFNALFTAAGLADRVGEPERPYGAGEIPRPAPSPRQKLVLFTEHRDTLRYLRYGERPEVRARLDTAVDQALDRSALQDLLEERQLVHDAMDATRVQRVREEMERADARRLQPHYVESFFREAFRRLGGTVRQREARRYQVTHVPAVIRNRDRAIGVGEPVLPRYERIAFEKPLVAPPGQPLAAFVCPGHPLLDAVIDLTLERNRELLKRGAVLVDERDADLAPRPGCCSPSSTRCRTGA